MGRCCRWAVLNRLRLNLNTKKQELETAILPGNKIRCWCRRNLPKITIVVQKTEYMAYSRSHTLILSLKAILQERKQIKKSWALSNQSMSCKILHLTTTTFGFISLAISEAWNCKRINKWRHQNQNLKRLPSSYRMKTYWCLRKPWRTAPRSKRLTKRL